MHLTNFFCIPLNICNDRMELILLSLLRQCLEASTNFLSNGSVICRNGWIEWRQVWNLGICLSLLSILFLSISPVICFNFESCGQFTSLLLGLQSFVYSLKYFCDQVINIHYFTDIKSHSGTSSTQIDLGKSTWPQMYYLDFTNLRVFLYLA